MKHRPSQQSCPPLSAQHPHRPRQQQQLQRLCCIPPNRAAHSLNASNEVTREIPPLLVVSGTTTPVSILQQSYPHPCWPHILLLLVRKEHGPGLPIIIVSAVTVASWTNES
jgi:hypothetical protein